jgi:RNA polymerase sigma factor for flagellar operon FliA
MTKMRHRGMALLTRPDRVEAALWRALHSDPGHEEARHTLFARHQPFARRLAAAQYARRAAGGFERGDIEQLAYEALLHAIARYDPTRGIPFEGYARRRILGHISNGLAQMSESAAQYRYRQRAERDRLRSLREGQDATEAQQGALAALAQLASLLAIGLMAQDAIDPDELADDQPNAYETLAWHEMRIKLRDAIAALPERERYLISQYYTAGVSFQHIAAIWGVSKGRVSQIHRAALIRLRGELARFR